MYIYCLNNEDLDIHHQKHRKIERVLKNNTFTFKTLEVKKRKARLVYDFPPQLYHLEDLSAYFKYFKQI